MGEGAKGEGGGAYDGSGEGYWGGEKGGKLYPGE